MMKKDSSKSSWIIVIAMFVITLATMLLLMFRGLLNSEWVYVMIVILPSSLALILYLIYRKNHLRHIYSSDKIDKK